MIFRYKRLLDKHDDAVHVDIIIFCHYYNNNKDCPFDDVCIFEHDESPQCKYGKGCERKMCMYTHDDKDDDSDESSDDEIGDAAVENLKPVLEKVKKAVEKCDSLIDQCSFKCKLCDFEAKDKNGLTMHTKAKHTTKANQLAKLYLIINILTSFDMHILCENPDHLALSGLTWVLGEERHLMSIQLPWQQLHIVLLLSKI